MHVYHDPALVLISIGIAILASYTALGLAGRVATSHARARAAWLGGGSIAMGVGIWSMHFVGMLAFRLPRPMAYHMPQMALSVVVAVGASALALWVVARRSVKPPLLVVATLFMGAAIAGMHYIGMASIRTTAWITYDPLLVVASVAIAIAASGAALWLALRFRFDESRRGRWGKRGSAVIMGLAIAGMHYTAMGAADFHTPLPGEVPTPIAEGDVLATSGLAGVVVVSTLIILGIALLGVMADRWLRFRAAEAAALRRSEDRFRSLVTATSHIVWTAAPDGAFVTDQPEWSTFTGQHFEQYHGSGWQSAIHAADRERVVEAWTASVRSGSPLETEYWLRRHDGEYRYVVARAVPVIEEDGSIREWIGAYNDVTRRWRAEQERERLLTELAEQAAVAERARAEAEEANRAKSEFLATMSHELRTPLNAIGGYADLLQMEIRGPITDAQRVDLQKIQRAQRQLLGLINDVLNFAKIEAGHVRFHLEDVPLDLTLACMEALIEPQVGAKGLRYEYVPGDRGVRVRADRDRLEQIVLNLLSNAIKFTPQGGTITLAWEADDGWARIRVDDTGIGIPPDKLDSIFEPFVQVDAGLTRGSEGTGLGLAISRDLARAMRGDLAVRSTEGEGSTFVLTIPTTGEPTPEAPAAALGDRTAAAHR